MGIFRVTLADLDTTTNGGVDGYQDYGCRSRTARLVRGTSYSFAVRTNPNADETVRAWVDFDRNGAFGPTELVMSSTGRQHSATFTVPPTAATGVALRLRVAADYSNAPVPTACSTPQYSQTEDYRLVVSAAAPPRPQSQFITEDTVTCSGTVVFRDQSLNTPTAWQWSFGDGAASPQQHPQHTYAQPGLYAVRLRACNATGCDSLTKANYVRVRADAPRAAPCQPATAAHCCGFGLTRVRLGALDHASLDGRAGYEDFSCARRTTLTADRPTTLQLTTAAVAHDVRVYLDLNDNGQFDLPGELLYQGLGVQSPVAALQVAAGPGVVYHRPLRLRLWADAAGSAPFGPCAPPQFGQVEDYAVTVLPNLAPPTARFNVAYAPGCGPTQVTLANATTGGATSYAWDFGDGTGFAGATPPAHAYPTGGVYELTLVARNGAGTDTAHQAVAVATRCPTYCQPDGTGGSASSPAYFTRVQVGALDNTDVRVPRVSYRDFTARTVALQQGQPYTVRAESLPYPFGNGPWVRVTAWLDYNQDGIFSLPERLGQLTVVSPYLMPFRVPLNAPVGATRLRLQIVTASQYLDDQNSCPPSFYTVSSEDYTVRVMPAAQPPRAGFAANLSPSCNATVQFTDTTGAGPGHWQWNFGDGSGSTQQHPQHTYANPGSYSVTLAARNRFGTGTATRPNYVTIVALNQGPRPAGCLPAAGADIDVNGAWEINRFDVGAWRYNNPLRLAAYRDETCAAVPIPLSAGVATALRLERPNYAVSVATWVQLWLDANDDGVFDPVTERVYNSLTTSSSPSGPWVGTLTAPAGCVRGRPLRLRLWSMLTDRPANYTGYNMPCYRHDHTGQIRDFTVVVTGSVTASLPEGPKPTAWSIAPNPATDRHTTLWGPFRTGQRIQLEVRDAAGRLVLTQHKLIGMGGNVGLSFPSLPQGLYIVRLLGEHGHQRLVIL